MGWEQLAQDRREEIARLAEILSGRLTEITRLLAEVERLREELSGRHPSYQSALALLFTFVCPEESFDPTQPILMGKRIKDAVARLTGELAAVRRERDDVKEALHATVSNTESMTYGELPNSLQELIHPHEFDNMTISEQRAWSIGRFADVTQELDETLEAATQQYEEELAACRNPDHKMTLLESIKWLVAERNLALARNAALEEAGDAMANSADCVGLHNRNEVKHWRQVRGERP